MRIELEAHEVEKALDDRDDFYWSEVGWLANNGSLESVEIEGISFPFKVLEEFDGDDLLWDYEVYVVFKVGNQVFRKVGRHISHDGTHWNKPLEEVHAVEKTITVWEAK